MKKSMSNIRAMAGAKNGIGKHIFGNPFDVCKTTSCVQDNLYNDYGRALFSKVFENKALFFYGKKAYIVCANANFRTEKF